MASLVAGSCDDGGGDVQTVVIEPRRGFVGVDLRELWAYRELVGFLALRNLKVRYKQSLLGVSWAIAQPLLTVLVFNLLFGLLLGADRKPTLPGVPYVVSTYCGLIAWQLFASTLLSSGDSLVANQNLVTKVYFPRLVAPLAPALTSLVDFALAFAVLLVLMAAYGVAPGPAVALLPLFVGMAIAAALSVSLWLSALNALYRDVRHALPFAVQLWMFATPVVYTAASVAPQQHEGVRWLFALNPMAGVVEGFRWALLGGAHPPWSALVSSAVVVALLLVGGAFFFRRLERRFADLI